MKNNDRGYYIQCPIPVQTQSKITMAHGGGGSQMNKLIQDVFVSTLDTIELRKRHDGAIYDSQNGRYAFTTDSFVINPLFFPGGDIGSLSVIGTANDLAMCGAKPLFISVGLIIEEGFSIETLTQIIQSMKKAADKVGVQIVTGDTKVVEHGKGDGVYINTSGVGIINHQLNISPETISPGDAIIINRDIGCHGIAVMSVREGFQFESLIESDCAPLADTVMTLINNGVNINCLRDLTRGGLSSALTELAASSQLHFALEENGIPISPEVNNACEILGYDPMQVANEGTFVLFVPTPEADNTLNILKTKLGWKNASIIGQVADNEKSLVTLKTDLGTERIITAPAGEQLPRIC
ncbi:MAG: hydrogenase expression/formation protein HypE [Candidatus Zixiibacteriota bacterium]